jgi:hypothetical protein
MTNIRCFCSTCGKSQDVVRMYIAPCGTHGYEMTCGHVRMIEVFAKEDYIAK